MERNVKHLLLKKLTLSKLQFSRKENLKKCTHFEEHKVTRYIRGNVYIGIIVFSSFVLKTLSQISFKLFCLGDKAFIRVFSEMRLISGT